MKTRGLKESFLRITRRRRVRPGEIKNFKRQFKNKLLGKTRNFGLELMEHAPENRKALVSGEFAEFINFANALRRPHRRMFLSLLAQTIWDYESATDEHQRRVSYGCRKVTYAMGSRIDRKNLKLAARFHDFGKISWPKEFLAKKGPLNTGEMQLIEAHLYLGFHFFELIGFTKKASRILWYNHVHDGYPYFKNLEEVPIEGQILSAVDVFDAMTSPRLYRDKPKFSQKEAFEELVRRQYHPTVLETIRRELILSGTWDELGL
jgi:HD-GYP domain-containing protein (c-di-GMP phosphodiesterase class II)